MYVRYASLVMVPVLGENLGYFEAPNPWSGSRQERWSINLYNIVSKTYATNAQWNAFNQQQKNQEDLATRRQKIQGKKLSFSKSIGIESMDGRHHQLPRVLIEMWRAGEVEDAQLPELLRQFEPVLKPTDFKTRRIRTILFGEGVMFLVIAFAALIGFFAIRGIGGSSHHQVKPSQESWLARPMTEQAIWAQGMGVPAEHCFKLRPGLVKPPAGLNTYGDLNLICSFRAQNESRLVLREMLGGDTIPENIILRGVVLAPSQFGLSPQLLSGIAQKVPNLNTNLIFVYNTDWGGSGYSQDLDEIATILGWAVFLCPIPYLIYLVAARAWRAHDARLREQFRAALGGSAPGYAAQPAAIHPL